MFAPEYTVGLLEQEPQLDPTKTVKEIVEEGILKLKEFARSLECQGILAYSSLRSVLNVTRSFGAKSNFSLITWSL